MLADRIARALYRTFLFGCLLCLSSGCAGRRYYADLRLVPDPRALRAAGLRETLLGELPAALTQAGIKRVAVITPEGSTKCWRTAVTRRLCQRYPRPRWLR